MIEAAVYKALEKYGRPIAARDLAALMGRSYTSVSPALMRLKARKAAASVGCRKCALWVAMPGAKIEDGRGKTTGQRHLSKLAKLAKFDAVPPPRRSKQPVYASPLAQALSWEP